MSQIGAPQWTTRLMVCGDIPSGMDGAGGAGGMGACIGKNLDLGEDRAGAEWEV